MRWGVLAPLVSVLLASLPAWAAGKSPTPEVPAPLKEDYRLQPGDTLEFRFPFSPELNFTAPVRPDGGLFFAHIGGDVQAGGQTVAELHRELLERYSKVLRDPEIVIILKEFQRPHVYVGGEVKLPGRLDYYRGMSVSTAIFTAGGYKETANEGTALLMRRATAESARVVKVKLSRRRGTTVHEVLLAPEDIVLVPKSNIAKLDKIVRQYSRELLPISNLGAIFDAFGTTAVSTGVSAP